MPTILGHAIVGSAVLAFARPLLPEGLRWRAVVAGGVIAMLPDMDVVGFKLGVAYGSPFGHRGVTHSLLFAAATALLVTVGLTRPKVSPLLFVLLFTAALSHPLLDMLTNGGLGVALWAPWSWSRVFFAVTPIPVSPIGVGPSLPYVLSWEAAFFVPIFLGSLLAHGPKSGWIRGLGVALGILGTGAAFAVRLGF